VKIASDSNIAELYTLGLWGTHSFLDPNYSSAEMSVHHEDCHLSRLEKLGVIADWELGLSCLRVCSYRPEYHKSGTLNCGRCDKCIRTMLQLMIYGGLGRCSTFPNKVVTLDMIEHMEIRSPAVSFPQLVEPLEQIGRYDLAQPIEVKLKKIHILQYILSKLHLDLRKHDSPDKGLTVISDSAYNPITAFINAALIFGYRD